MMPPAADGCKRLLAAQSGRIAWQHRTWRDEQHETVLGLPASSAFDNHVRRGAPLDLEAAAGVGRLDVVKTLFNEDARLNANATKAQMKDGFACAY